MQERLLSDVWNVPFADVQFDFAEPSLFGVWGNIKIRKKIAQVRDIGNIDKIQVKNIIYDNRII
jgi:hypothetical protein